MMSPAMLIPMSCSIVCVTSSYSERTLLVYLVQFQQHVLFDTVVLEQFDITVCIQE